MDIAGYLEQTPSQGIRHCHCTVPVELYYNPYCTACGGVGEATDRRSASVHWIDATMHLEAAAKLRIVRLPALVIDGRLVVQGPRAFAQLRAWIARQGNDT